MVGGCGFGPLDGGVLGVLFVFEVNVFVVVSQKG